MFPHNDKPSHSVTSNIVYNLAQLGISIRDAELFDIATYKEIVEIAKEQMEGICGSPRKATQSDIDKFLL